MNEATSFTIRKSRMSNIASMFFAFGTIPLVGIGINLFIERSPMEFLNPFFWFFGVVFLLIGLYIFVKYKSELVIQEGEDGGLKMVINPDSESPFEIKGLSSVSPVWIRVHVGNGKSMRELYLIFYDAEKKPILTLKHTLGTIHTMPDGFNQAAPNSLEINNTYTCKEISRVLSIVSRSKRL